MKALPARPPPSGLDLGLGRRSLIWLVLIAVALMGLMVTRQNVLGTLHVHTKAGPTSTSTHVAPSFQMASEWVNRWRQQQISGHLQPAISRTVDAFNLLPKPSNFRQLANDAKPGLQTAHHAHSFLERHHHDAADASVRALDVADAGAESASTSAAVGVPALGTPADGFRIPNPTAKDSAWPIDQTIALITRDVATLLRPPNA
jgi:hypothetical protein